LTLDRPTQKSGPEDRDAFRIDAVDDEVSDLGIGLGHPNVYPSRCSDSSDLQADVINGVREGMRRVTSRQGPGF
jgi:hypothetical protein